METFCQFPIWSHSSYIIHHTSWHHTPHIIHHTSHITHHTPYIIHHTYTQHTNRNSATDLAIERNRKKLVHLFMQNGADTTLARVRKIRHRLTSVPKEMENIICKYTKEKVLLGRTVCMCIILNLCCVCICVCVCTCMYVCVYVCMCVYMCVYACMCVYIYICMCMYVCVCMCWIA